MGGGGAEEPVGTKRELTLPLPLGTRAILSIYFATNVLSHCQFLAALDEIESLTVPQSGTAYEADLTLLLYTIITECVSAGY